MIALSFIGTRKYEAVTYVWREEKEFTTYLFPEAVAKIFEPEKMFLLVTPQAKQCEQFQTLKERLGDRLEPVDIPEGRSEAELWQIFERCAEVVSRGDELLLDVTHAFRSLPLIVFTAASYLRRTKGVAIRHIVYGAFEAREPFRSSPQPSDRAPIFDLTPLLGLLDWLSGAEFMLKRSDATLLAAHLKQIHGTAWQKQRGDELPRKLQSLGNTLANLSHALHLARPRDVMRYAQRLLQVLNEVKPEVKRWAKPFGVILEQVQAEGESLAYSKPECLDAENLRRQLVLIKHFVEKDLFAQAILLAREWVVSWVALHRGEEDWLDKEYREKELEYALGAASARLQGKETSIPEWFKQIPHNGNVAQLWSDLTNLRNDLAHCGMRKDAANIRSIQSRTKELPNRLKALMEGVTEHMLYGGRVVIDLKSLYDKVAKLDELPIYLKHTEKLAGEGNEVILTGQAPIWLYLAVAHALHGKARRLLYTSPATGEVIIFDHSAR